MRVIAGEVATSALLLDELAERSIQLRHLHQGASQVGFTSEMVETV
jgi:hypothetical protein